MREKGPERREEFLYDRKRRRWKPLFFVLFLFFWACSLHKIPSEGALLERVNSYWQAVIKGYWDLAYDYEYPLFKKLTPREVYLSRRRNPLVRITGFKVEGVSFKDEDRAEVKIKLHLVISLPGTRGRASFDMPVVDHWQRVEGKWYHVPKKGKIFQDKRGKSDV